jgi:uncharacterized protein
MPVIIWFILSAIAAFLAIRELSAGCPSTIRRVLTAFDIIVSIFAGYLIIRALVMNAEADTPEGIMAVMQYNLAIMAIIIPRTSFAILHYAGRLIRLRRKGRIWVFSATGASAGIVLFAAMLYGYLFGRFNFRYEQVEISFPGLHPDLDGIRIVQLSDLHLGSFYGSAKKVSDEVERINSFKPHLIVNTGDFITLGHREYGRFDTILVRMVSRYGNYAVLGNHDIGTYLPGDDSDRIRTTIRKVSELVNASGYTILDQSNIIIQIGEAKLALAGVETRGRHPVMIHQEIDSAMLGTENADLTILLSHDPNHWDEILEGQHIVDLTLAGHTHGMQFGLLTRWFNWSPAKYSYPRWYGLYREGDMQLYVNRGLGVLGIPVRVGMPPEVTIITLRSE